MNYKNGLSLWRVNPQIHLLEHPDSKTQKDDTLNWVIQESLQEMIYKGQEKGLEKNIRDDPDNPWAWNKGRGGSYQNLEREQSGEDYLAI